LQVTMTDKKKHDHHPQAMPEEAAGEEAVQESPATAKDSIEAVRAELEAAKAQNAEYLDGWKRTQAEFSNYRKRVERDAADERVKAVGLAASRWLPILDDFERALAEGSHPDNYDRWAAGVELIYRKGMAALEADGIEPICPEPGTAFDPTIHEAVTKEMCPDKEDGEILGTVRRGYRLGDRILRPAQVRVACRPEPDSESNPGPESPSS
jgi:molecular chaperone GrpE